MALIKTLSNQSARIKVFGVGGGGNNAVNRMAQNQENKNIDLVAVNTDSQALLQSSVQIKLQIGEKLTRGLGSGSDPNTGTKAAEESKQRIEELLDGADMVFITGGMGGGTCTGAAPIIAGLAKQKGILTVAVVTKPFSFEGTKRQAVAEEGIRKLKTNVDTLVVVPNQKVLENINKKLTLEETLKMADSTLIQGVQAIANLITKPGLINLDFADVRAIMKNAGTALMGVGEAEGEDRAKKAVKSAISSPILDMDISDARGILLNICGGPDLTIAEVEDIATQVTHSVEADANIIFGANIDPDLKGKIKITVIATGFSSRPHLGFSSPSSGSLSPTSPKQEEITKTPEEKTIPEKPAPNPKELEKILQGHPLPEGVEIENDLDIPSFLRQS